MTDQVGSTSPYLVVTADDAGKSPSINRAVEIAARSGIVMAVSIMPTGAAFDGAVDIVLRNSRLSAGLHVALSGTSSVLPRSAIPDLVDFQGNFPRSPAVAGILYWKRRRTIESQLADEVAAQFDRMEAAGLYVDHVDCHHHLHMHPLVFSVLAREAGRRGVRWIRIPKEPLAIIVGLHLRLLDPTAFFKWLAFGLLFDRSLFIAHKNGLRSVNNVYGVSETGRMSEKYVLALLPHLAGATNEIYLHPDMDTLSGRLELKTATSGRVWAKIRCLGLRLTSFSNITGLTGFKAPGRAA